MIIQILAIAFILVWLSCGVYFYNLTDGDWLETIFMTMFGGILLTLCIFLSIGLLFLLVCLALGIPI